MKKHKQINKDESLYKIFQDDTGAVPDLGKFETHHVSRIGAILFMLCSAVLMVLVTIFAGYRVLYPADIQSTELILNILGPEKVLLGSETTYFINWKNTSSHVLSDVNIHVSFPSEFSVTVSDPRVNQKELKWNIGYMAIGARGTLTVKGIFTGSLGKQTSIQAIGTYHLNTDTKNLEALSTRVVTYTDTVIQGKINIPEKALSGDKVKISYSVLNTGSVLLKNVEMRFTVPKEFIVDATSSVLNTGEIERTIYRKSIGDLGAGASTTVSISGTYVAGTSGDIDWAAELGTKSDIGIFQTIHVAHAHMIVLSGDLHLNLVVNGSDANRSIAYGDILHFTLGYQNASTEDLRGVVLKLKFDSTKLPYLDWNKLETIYEGTTSSISTSTLPDIIFDKKKLSVLDRLAPSAEGTIDFSVPAIGTASGSAPGFSVIVEASIAGLGNTKISRVVATAPMHFLFKSDADIFSRARYFAEEGVQLGSGPLPPLYGSSTTYHIEWDVMKHAHEIKDLVVSSILPKNVSWIAKSSTTAGSMTYNETNRRVSWILNRMPESVEEVNAEFDVSLMPTEYDIGRFAVLLGETRFEATDSALNESIVKTKSELNTDLQDDEGAKHKGVVRK